MHPRLADLTLVTLAPLLWTQGKLVRQRTPKLPEPDGPRFGTRGEGRPLSVLILGDSAAAGVGSPTLEEALLGRLLDELTPSFEVTFCLHARTGMTSSEALEELFEGEHTKRPWDVVVTSLGVNDATALKRSPRFAREQRALVERMQEVFSPSLILLSGLPPVHRFPALPQPLRSVIGARATRLDETLAEIAHATGATHISLSHKPELILEHIAADGFHPGPGGYAEWAALVAEAIRGQA